MPWWARLGADLHAVGDAAVGDIHGDLQKAITALKVAGVLAEDGYRRPLWMGGDTFVVQLGDVLDRGDCEIGAPVCTCMSHTS